jgi:kynureninase
MAEPPLRAEFPALEESLWLCSHVLGCLPARAAEDLTEYLADWQRGPDAWERWLPLIDEVAADVGRLLSAPRGTVTMLGSAAQAFATIASCYDFPPARDGIVYADAEHPGGSYVWQAEARRGARVTVVAGRDGGIDEDALIAAIEPRTALVAVSAVSWRASTVADLRRIVAAARAAGADVVLDADQATGVVPLDVVDLGVAFAVGGTAGVLCGGPGAAYLYVRRDKIDRLEPRVTGEFGHEAPFGFEMPAQRYAEGIWRFLGGTPGVGALVQARAGLALAAGQGARPIRERSLAATARAIAAIDARGFALRSPREEARRGPVVAFDFVGAPDVARELGRRRCLADHPPGAGLRIAPHYYNRDDEVDAFFAELDAVRGR